MGPKASSRFRQATAVLATGWALVALLSGLRSTVDSMGRPTPPLSISSAAGRHVVVAATPAALAAGVAARDRLLGVDGVDVSAALRRGGFDLREGASNLYAFERPSGERYERELTPLPAGRRAFAYEGLVRWGIPLVGFAYLAIGASVWRLRGDRRESWALLLFCAVTAALLFSVAPTVDGWLVGELTVPWVGATALHLFTTYPIEPSWALRYPGVRPAAYVGAAVLSLAALLQPWLGPLETAVEPVVTFYAVILAVGCLVTVFIERFRHRRQPAAARSDVLIAGAAASYLPVAGILTWHTAFGTSFPWMLSMLGFFLFPLAVGYGIVRRELFDVRQVARSSAAYGTVTLAITGLFALLITFADAAFRRFNVDARSPWFSFVFLIFAILAFNPLRERVQALVDRFFDRDRAAYRRAVREISEAMVSMLSAKEIVDRILVALTDTMGVERAMVLLVQEPSERLQVEASRGDWDRDAAGFSLEPEHPICRSLWMQRRELAREDFDEQEDLEQREACRDVFDTLEVELLVPVLFGIDLLGVIAVGRQHSGERLGVDERQLLRTLANQSAIAIENARAFDEIAQLNRNLEARVEDRTRELRDTQAQLVQSEKMRSLGQLVAGVAHELNNPIGFVHANLALLEEYVARLTEPGVEREKREKAREAIAKLLARSREGTARVKQIVQDLRTFSRTDQAELQQVCLNDEIDRTLSLMEPRLKTGVEVVRDYGELPPVRCYAGQLNQVFMNLVMNACDAMDGRGRITLRTRAVPEGVVLEFQDSGPGISPEARSRIFEPFFTTKPVGQGTGLGLSLSHGIVARHGGALEVESRPGEGACFRIRLPHDPPPEAASDAA